MNVIFKNEIIEGKKMCELISVNGIYTREMVPCTYTEDIPYVVGVENGFRVYVCGMFGGQRYTEYKIGMKVSPEEKGEIIKALKRSGKKLYEINKQISEWKVSWEGKEEVVVI